MIDKREIAYFAYDGTGYKIGKSTVSGLRQRRTQLRTGNRNLFIVGYTTKYTERELHNKYWQYRYDGEWFRFPDDVLREVELQFDNDAKVMNAAAWVDYRRMHYEGKERLYNPTSYNKENYMRFTCDESKSKYKIGKFHFSGKKNLLHFNRGLLDCQALEAEVADVDVIDFALDLLTHHPNYRNEIKETFKKLTVEMDDKEHNRTTNVCYSNFCIHYGNKKWNFSSQKCLDNIKGVNGSGTKQIHFKDGKFMWGRYKHQTFEFVMKHDPKYIQWAYANISAFREQINNTKYQQLVKINM